MGMLDARINILICFSLTNLSFADLICRALALGYDSKVGTGEEFLSPPTLGTAISLQQPPTFKHVRFLLRHYLVIPFSLPEPGIL